MKRHKVNPLYQKFVRIYDEEFCKELQKYAFKTGYTWSDGFSEEKHANAKVLFFDSWDDGVITKVNDVDEEYLECHDICTELKLVYLKGLDERVDETLKYQHIMEELNG